MSRICVYCASSDAVADVHFQAAAELGKRLAEGGHSLIYGGGSVGLMGAVARAVHENGGPVVGIIPEALNTIEVAYQDADEMIVTRDMRERKGLMDQYSDVCVTLPGGFGTLDEILEMLTLKQLNYHEKPIIFLNTAGYFNPLRDLFEHLFATKFAKERYRELYYLADSVSDLFAYLDNYEPPEAGSKFF